MLSQKSTSGKLLSVVLSTAIIGGMGALVPLGGITASAAEFSPPGHSFGVIGGFNEWAGDMPMTDPDGDGVYEATVDVVGTYEFRVRADNSWDYSWGVYEPDYDRTQNSQTNFSATVKEDQKLIVRLDTTKVDDAAKANPDSYVNERDFSFSEDGYDFWPVTYEIVCMPAGLTLDKISLTLTEGATGEIKAYVLPVNATDKTVKWNSGNTSIVTVDSNGKLKAVGVGTTTIAARTVNGIRAACRVTVKAPAVKPTGIALNKTSLTITKGSTATLTATVSPSNATNKKVTWTTSNSAVATVSAGKVTAKGAGTATITACTANGKTAKCTVKVNNPVVKPTSISLSKTSLSLTTGGTATLSATVYPSNATNKSVTWTTSNSSVATVSAGKVTAKGAGTATITAKTVNGMIAKCTVKVTNPVVHPNSVKLSASTLSITAGNAATLTATVYPSNATNKSVTWTTSNSSVATVSNGRVSAKSAGTAVITARTVNGLTASCTVTVKAKSTETTAQKNFRTVANYIENHYDGTLKSGAKLIMKTFSENGTTGSFSIAYYKSEDKIQLITNSNDSTGTGLFMTVDIYYKSLNSASVTYSILMDDEIMILTSAKFNPAYFTANTHVSMTLDYSLGSLTSSERQQVEELLNTILQTTVFVSDVILRENGMDISYIGFTSY